MIRRLLLSAAALLSACAPALAQQRPLVISGGQIQRLPAGTTLGVQPATTGAASLNIPHGTAPTSPVNGDCWTTTAGFFCRVNGSTVGPFGTASGGTVTSVAISGGTTGLTASGGPVTGSGTLTLGGTLGLANGGTGGTDAASARASLGAGSVSSVGITPPSIMTAGGAVTGSGNISLSLNSQAANLTLASPSGSAGVPTFRALNTADLPVGTSGATIPLMSGANTWSGQQTFSSITQVNMGSSSVPALWLKTSLSNAWPGMIIENLSTHVDAQAQLFFRMTDDVGKQRVWQLAMDNDNAGFKHVFAIEAIDPGVGVISTPFAAFPSGEVGIGSGLPRIGSQLTVAGDIRVSRNSTAGVDGAIAFGNDNDAQIYGTDTGAIVTLINGTAMHTVNGLGTTVNGTLKLTEYTVAALPTCNAGSIDRLAVVSNANAPTWNSVLAGGGTVRALAYCNGVNWTAH